MYPPTASNKVVPASFPAANCSWQVSSLSETKAHQLMQQKAMSFIKFNQRQLSRIYPSSYRVDSSNFNPQPFWNAGCQLGMSSVHVFTLLSCSLQWCHPIIIKFTKHYNFYSSCTQLPVWWSSPAAQQSQVLQQWQLWLHHKACLHVWRSV